MTESEAKGVGARLKRLREGKRIGLREIANTTKISMPALDAIERDEPRKLPGGIFGRSFVRAYARELGLDPDETAREFFAQFPEMAEPSEPVEDMTRQAVVRERALAVLPALGLLVAAGVVGLWLFTSSPGDSSAPLPAGRIAAVSTDVPAPLPVRVAVDAVPALGSVSTAEPAGEGPLTLHIAARADCWVAITADGREVVARLLTAGDEEAVRARSELRVKVGDATAVSLRLNGVPVRALGAPGQVVTLRIDPSNAREWLASH